MTHKLRALPLLLLLWLLPQSWAHADRIKDMASIAAMRGNQLIGFGLVAVLIFGQGLGTYLEYQIGTPGSGQMIVGAVMAAIFLGAFIVRWAREK